MGWQDNVRDLVGATAAEALAPYGPDRLGQMSVAELRALQGVGTATARRVVAAFEVAREAQRTRRWRGERVASSHDVFRVMSHLRDERAETFWTLCLDARNRLVEPPVYVARGGTQHVAFEPSDVIRPVIRSGAAALVVVHNHPSGDPEPSAEDMAFTRLVVSACKHLGLRLLDHVVIGDGSYVSFADRGMV